MEQLSWQEIEGLLSKYKLPLCKTRLIKTVKEAKNAAKGRYPVVLKLSSKKMIHKTGVGGVIINIKSEEELEKAFLGLEKKFKKNGFECLVQEMVKGTEVIVGMKKDEQFGPAIMFGLGGIFVEVMKDLSFRIAPITKKQAEEMIKEIKAFPILEGIRGKPCNTTAIADIIEKLSRLAIENDKIVELDFNPIIVNKETAKIVDVRITRK